MRSWRVFDDDNNTGVIYGVNRDSIMPQATTEPGTPQATTGPGTSQATTEPGTSQATTEPEPARTGTYYCSVFS